MISRGIIHDVHENMAIEDYWSPLLKSSRGNRLQSAARISSVNMLQ